MKLGNTKLRVVGHYFCCIISKVVYHAGMLKISLAGANNSVPTAGLTPCIVIVHVYIYNYSGAEKNIDAAWHSLAPRMAS